MVLVLNCAAAVPMFDFACLTADEDLTYNPPSLGVSPDFALQIAQSRPTPFFRLFAPEGR
jgi:hypothetical protein